MSNTSYTPWRPDEFPMRHREIVAVAWGPGGLRIEVADAWKEPPSLAITFKFPRAYQGIDEGYRLLDIPIGQALIYSAAKSHYLATFLSNASGTMDNMGVLHWVIVSANECVDVLSEREPVVSELGGHDP